MNRLLYLKYNSIEAGDTVNYFDFGEILRNLRKSSNLTQKELGEQLGLSKAVISKYETGIGYPTFDTLIRISKYFGVTTDYLLGASKGKTVDVTGLTESQIGFVRKLIAEFQKLNQNK